MLPLLILTLLSSVYAHTAWSGQYTMTTPAMISYQGRVNAFVYWNWNAAMWKIDLGPNANAPRTSEVYQFNAASPSNRGYSTAPTQQWLFTTGSATCTACASAGWNNAMPPFDIASTWVTSVSTPNTDCGTNLRKYTPKTGSYVNSLESYVATSTGTVCSFTLKDGRTFDLVSGTFKTQAPTITIPTGCACSQAIDIMFLIDRSLSISGNDMKQFKNFVVDFVNRLDLGPDSVWVGMSHFSSENSPAVGLTSNSMVYTKTDFNSLMKSWNKSCPDSGRTTSDCFIAATATGAGMKFASTQLYKLATRDVPKLIVTLTDGGQNTKMNGGRCDGMTSSCDDDIAAAMDHAKRLATPSKPLTFICAGIGKVCNSVNSCISPRNILAYADAVVGNNLTVSGFAALPTLTEGLMQQTCKSTDNIASTQCLNTCCGLCVCGKCEPPDSCATNLCATNALSPRDSCCVSTLISNVCPKANCTLTSCDPTLNNFKGQCVSQPIVCSVSNDLCNGCRSWHCDPAVTDKCDAFDDSKCLTPVDCKYSSYTNWADCSISCGDVNGTQHRSRTITQQPQNCGVPCDDSTLSETRSCTPPPCPIDCQWGPWGAWSDCSSTCDGGTQTATRAIQVPMQYNGINCDNQNTKKQECFITPCPVDCVLDPWGDYSECSALCGGGTQTRTRTVNEPAQYGGTCTNELSITRDCNTQDCCQQKTLDTGVNPWICNCTTQEESVTFRYEDVVPQGGGSCLPDDLVTTRPCSPTNFNDNCPIDCDWAWDTWSVCDCDAETRSRNSIIITPANDLGSCEIDDSQTENCVPVNCPVDCDGYWGAFGECTCEAKAWTRTFFETVPAEHGGEPCLGGAPYEETQPCDTYVCPVDCIAEYTPFTDCSCTTKTQERTYIITVEDDHGGLNCEASNNTVEVASCEPDDCPFYGPVCTTVDDCDDGMPCTVDRCIEKPDGLFHCDNTEPTVCNDDSICTSDTCDPIEGCNFPPALFCDDSNACTEDICHPVNGCQHTNVTCPDLSPCFPGACHPTLGCQVEQLECRNASTANDSCLAYSCDDNATNEKYCVESDVCTFPVMVVGIAAGAAAGIAVGCFAALVIFSGATYAVASQSTTVGAVATTTNPLYAPNHTSGENPMFVETPRVEGAGMA